MEYFGQPDVDILQVGSDAHKMLAAFGTPLVFVLTPPSAIEEGVCEGPQQHRSTCFKTAPCCRPWSCSSRRPVSCSAWHILRCTDIACAHERRPLTEKAGKNRGGPLVMCGCLPHRGACRCTPCVLGSTPVSNKRYLHFADHFASGIYSHRWVSRAGIRPPKTLIQCELHWARQTS